MAAKKKTPAKKKKAPATKKTAAKKATARKKPAATKKASTKKTTTKKAASKTAAASVSVDEKKLAKAVADAVKPLVEKVEKAVTENRKKIDAISKEVSKAAKPAPGTPAGPDAKEIGKLITSGVKPALDAVADLSKVVDKLGKAVDGVTSTASDSPAIDAGTLATAVAAALRGEINGLHDAMQDSYKLLESVKRLTESLADSTSHGSTAAPAIDADAIGAAIGGALSERLGEIADELALLREENEQLRRENRTLHRVQAVEADVDPVIDSGTHDRDDVLAALDDDDDAVDHIEEDDDDSDVSAEDIMAAASQSGENEAIALDNRARQMLAKIDQMRETEGSTLNERHVWNEVVIFYGNDGRDNFYRDLGVLYDSGRLVGLPMLTADVLDRRGALPK